MSWKLISLSVVVMVADPSLAADPSWSAMTFNVLYNGADNDRNLSTIGEHEPDIICLQEVTAAFVREFEAKLGKIFPHCRFEPRSGTWGVGIASKHPLRNVNVFKQAPHRMPAMEAAVALGGRTVVVACLHLFPPGAKRRKDISTFEAMEENATLRVQQAKSLVARYSARKGAVLLLGDMNESSNDDAIEVFTSNGYSDSCAIDDEDCGGTYPGATSLWPAVVQIDHILGRGVKFAEAFVPKTGGSDHYPVVARFQF